MNGVSRIAVKADVLRIPKLIGAGFDVFEIYLRDEGWLRYLPPTDAEICAVHQLSLVRHEGAHVRANLCDPGPIGERSVQVLAETIAYAAQCHAPKVVIHPGYYDAFEVSRESALSVLAQRLDGLHHAGVTICVENIPRWSNSLFTREAAIALPADFELWRRLAPPGTGLVFDVEHFCLSTIVAELAADFSERFRSTRDSSELRSLEQAVDDAFLAHTSRDWDVLHQHVTCQAEAAVSALAPYLAHVHVCGSDFVNFGSRDDREGVGIYKGEHLPIMYLGLSADLAVEDRIHHDRWIAALRGYRPSHIVIEVTERPEFDVLKELKRSRDFLEQTLGR